MLVALESLKKWLEKRYCQLKKYVFKQGKRQKGYNIQGIRRNKMNKTITSKSMLGTPVEITFEDNYDYVLWGNEVTIVKSFDKLPKTDTAYNVLKDFKGATSVMATYKGNNKRCVIYERKNPRCSNWVVHYCNMN